MCTFTSVYNLHIHVGTLNNVSIQLYPIMYVYPTSTHDPLYDMTVYHVLCSCVRNVFYCSSCVPKKCNIIIYIVCSKRGSINYIL